MYDSNTMNKVNPPKITSRQRLLTSMTLSKVSEKTPHAASMEITRMSLIVFISCNRGRPNRYCTLQTVASRSANLGNKNCR